MFVIPADCMFVIPAQAGIQYYSLYIIKQIFRLDSRLRGNDAGRIFTHSLERLDSRLRGNDGRG